ncbi:LacI family transcriptional regulator [Candidatus Bipolaricaulota bacterium]|nr:LacI family transcriptional regulator [Candidatus Bipolaricaulota bacterium]
MVNVTMRDVARAAGVSVNTVSRALAGKPDVSPETRARVLKVAEELGYRPNKLARGLRSNKTRTIGVIVTDIANPYFGALVKGVREAAYRHGYSIILQDTDEDYAREGEAIEVMLAERVDGLLITPVQTGTETIEKLKESGLPFVLLGRHFDDLETDYVVTDDVQGGYLATEHLIKLGHTRIAMINGPLHISSAKERLEPRYCARG